MDRLRQHLGRIALVLGVFALFLANAMGAFELELDLAPGALSAPAIFRSTEFVVLLGVGTVLSLLLPALSPVLASALTFVCSLPVVYLGYARVGHSLVPMEYSLLTILVLFGVNVLSSYFAETREKQRLLQLFGQYVPPPVVRTLARDPARTTLAGEARELTVMFCDVRDFTAVSERLSPRELTDMLNSLFTPLTEVLYRHHGTIDKYMGDAVMAFWGAPVADPQHARHALSAAFDVQSVLRELSPGFRERGWPEISMGIGLNTGMMNVGNMGSVYRVAYTVVGDAVNLAARLEQLTRTYGVGMIVGEATRERVPELVYRELDRVQVKGKRVAARIFEPLGSTGELDPETLAAVRRHNAAVRSYYAGDWEHAANEFAALGERTPGDAVYPLLLARIAEYRNAPPPFWEPEPGA